ncbi:MAG: hypothetical protein IPM29_00170 [Planctomycetes bacterium]|nr:hypothetical protein [Planctomycetota bacterium]
MGLTSRSAPGGGDPPELAGRLRKLRTLARALCHDTGLGLRAHDGNWAWSPADRTILVPAKELATAGPERCARIVAHECGHQMISRYHLLRIESLEPHYAGHLLNSCEDPRVDRFVATRFLGLRPAMARQQQIELAELRERDLRELPWFVQFCAVACIDGPHLDHAPELELHVHDAVRRALSLTRRARLTYVLKAPPPDLRIGAGDRERVEQAYANCADVLLSDRDRPSLVEQLVRAHAVDAHRLFEREIAPRAEALLRRDRREVGDDRLRELLGELRRNLAELVGAPELGISPRPLAGAKPLAFTRSTSDAKPGAGRRAGSHRPHPGPLLTERERYETVRARLAPLIRALEATFRHGLEPRRRRPWLGGFRDGPRVHLPAAMVASAGAQRDGRVFARRGAPREPDPAVLVLVDLSGSMAGAKADAARDATVALAEGLQRAGVDFAAFGFQDELLPLCAFDRPFDSVARDAIASIVLEVKGHCPGGHNQPRYNDDGPCLDAAARLLLRRRSTDRLLIVISDGQPAGRRSGEVELRAAIERLAREPLRVLALGLGPDTEHVERFYPASRANVPVAELADTLARLVRGAVVSHGAHEPRTGRVVPPSTGRAVAPAPPAATTADDDLPF